jgi:hypothetical protein
MIDLYEITDTPFNHGQHSYARHGSLFLRLLASADYAEHPADVSLAGAVDKAIAQHSSRGLQVDVTLFELLDIDCGLCQGAYFPSCSLCRGTNVADVPVTDDHHQITLNNVQLALIQSLPNCTLEAGTDPAAPYLVRFDGGIGLDYSGVCGVSTV